MQVGLDHTEPRLGTLEKPSLVTRGWPCPLGTCTSTLSSPHFRGFQTSWFWAAPLCLRTTTTGTNVTFIDTPPLGAVLSWKEVPPAGGDTLWASTSAAYEALSAPLQKLLGDLRAEHDFRRSFPASHYALTPEAAEKWEETSKKHPRMVHPVIRTHPVTGRKGLFVSEGFTSHIVDLKPKESEAILALLFAVLNSLFAGAGAGAGYEGDIAIWDNRNTQHYAVADYLPHRRVMHRATILGDKPSHTSRFTHSGWTEDNFLHRSLVAHVPSLCLWLDSLHQTLQVMYSISQNVIAHHV